MALFRLIMRSIHGTPRLHRLVPFNLADIGEGITEVEVIQWYQTPIRPIADKTLHLCLGM